MSDDRRDDPFDKLSVSFGEGEVFVDGDVQPENGISLTPEEAERLATALVDAAKKSRSHKYGN